MLFTFQSALSEKPGFCLASEDPLPLPKRERALFPPSNRERRFDLPVKRPNLVPKGRLGDPTAIDKSTCTLKAYQFMERLFEVLIGHGVDDGVDEGVKIA